MSGHAQAAAAPRSRASRGATLHATSPGVSSPAGRGKVDVLIITAMQAEYEAARQAGLASGAGGPGIEHWDEHDLGTSAPYLLGRYATEGGASFMVALARPTRMGSVATAPIVATLVERLKPQCLAMAGVCAGNPEAVALGDVIVAEMTYAYDEGKRLWDSFEGDHRQFMLVDRWVREAQELCPADLPSYGEACPSDAALWLLERLLAREDPTKHPARKRYFPADTWKTCVCSLEGGGLIARDGARLSLTEAGRLHIERVICDDVHGPSRLPFQVVVGPMASGNVVVKDGVTWRQLTNWGVRTVVAIEMEATTVASAAFRAEVPYWLVVKGVADHADPRKNDRYKSFATRASAEVLFKLLGRGLATIGRSPRID
ncbi:5'-methylthioadenosine/S-adenosylhomocysteine nucleosidase family protein [Paractinoplanes globisporus]|uniref:Nucleoside phosphorylase domain-containing protein n=1 Tax=Paractinoplanes globisporus TaxID=113565 RepID=A0ABW6WQ08_9ACTN